MTAREKRETPMTDESAIPEITEKTDDEIRAELDAEATKAARDKLAKRRAAEEATRIPSAKETRERLEEYKRSQLKKEKQLDTDPRTLRQRLSEGDGYAMARVVLSGLAMLGHIFRGAKEVDLAKRSVGAADALLEELDR